MNLATLIEATSALADVVRLLPQLTSRELDRQDQQICLTDLSNSSGWATSAALNAGWSAADALSLLEAGRGLIASAISDLQISLIELESKAPELAQQYSRLRYGLRTLNQFLESLENMGSQNLWAANSTSQRLEIAGELSNLEEKIRNIKGFENFMRAHSAPLKNLVVSNRTAVVAFNVTELRSDAFFVNKNGVEVISLLDLELSCARDVLKAFIGLNKLTEGSLSTLRKRNSQLRVHLSWLWDTAVKLVLERLGFLSSDRPRTPPRVTWISSGVLGIMPFQAAGRSWAASENTAFHVISSYAPTLRALRFSQEKLSRIEGLGKVLMLNMPKTCGYPDLKVDEEAKRVEESAVVMGSTVKFLQYQS